MSQAVVFLARGIDGGLPAARAFLDSYHRHAAGLPHDLIIIAKGWESVPGRDGLDDLAVAAGAAIVDLPDDGFDWGAYIRLAPRLDHEWVCFLNTHSRILADGWLAMLRRAAEQPGVGAAGATGSWGTMAPIFGNIGPIVMDIRRSRGPIKAVLAAGYGFTIGYGFHVLKWSPKFPRFRNPHLRSNALMMRCKTFAGYAANVSVPRTKTDAFELESGRIGLTRCLLSEGLQVMVAGRDGLSYEPEFWIESGTFRVPGQPNLLISDNQTRNYDAAPTASRRIMERSAWGRAFTPARYELASSTLR